MHHDLMLVGTADEVRALTSARVDAGAHHVDNCDCVHLEWRSDGPAPIESLAASHPGVDVRVRRIYDADDEVRELTVIDGRVVIDRKRRIFRESTGEVSCAWGLCMDEDGERLDPSLLHRVADEVLATVHAAPREALAAGDFDALELADQAGRFSRAVDDPFADDAPDAIALDALRSLASAALTISCAQTSKSAGEIRASRVWRMREVVVHASAEELWSTPDDACWPEWVRYITGAVCDAIEACHKCSWTPVVVTEDNQDYDRLLTPDGHRESALGSLVSTCVQALALFDRAAAAG